MKQKKAWYRIDIDAAVSDEYIIYAKSAAEAKKIAVKRFAKVKNFRFIFKRCRTREKAVETWL